MGSTELEITEGIPLDQPMKDDLDEDIAKAIDELLTPPDMEKEEVEQEEVEEETATEEIKESDLEEEKTEPVKTAEPEKKKRVEDIPAPEGLSAEAKEKFYKFPKSIRQEVKKRYDEMHADYTRKTQEVSAIYNQAKPVIDIVNQYLPRWGKAGLTPDRALSAILATNDQLVDPDPKVRKQAYAELFVNSGLTGQDFIDILESAGSPAVEKFKGQAQPQQSPLTEADKRRQNWIDSQINAQYQQQVNTAISEIQAVRDERDATGRYLWPRLHDQHVLEGQIKPLASNLIQQQSQHGQFLSWGDAVKRAYLALFPESASRLADKPNVQTTVRTSPTPRATGAMIKTASKASDIPDSIEDQIRMSIEELERGNY